MADPLSIQVNRAYWVELDDLRIKVRVTRASAELPQW
jgi:hypothetical protein